MAMKVSKLTHSICVMRLEKKVVAEFLMPVLPSSPVLIACSNKKYVCRDLIYTANVVIHGWFI
jgi:hypothetical protein